MIPSIDLRSLESDISAYDRFKNNLKEVFRENYKFRKEIGTLKLDNKTYEMPFGKVLVNLIFLRPFVECGIKIEEEDIFTGDSISGKVVTDYSNHYLTRYTNSHRGNNFDAFRMSLTHALDEFDNSSSEYNAMSGNSTSFFDYIMLIAEGGEAKKFLRPDIPQGLQFNEIEKFHKQIGRDYMNYVKTRPELEQHPYVISGTGINEKQNTQMCCFIGLKPDMFDGVIPKVITDNMIYGYSCLENYFINCIGTRKALCTNYIYVRKSGYLTRKLSLALMDRTHDADFIDCGTKHTVKYRVETKQKLNQIIGRHYYDIDESGNVGTELKTVTILSTNLIGKTIALRSPVTCNKRNGKVCATCYGRSLAEKNRNLNTGLNAVFLLTNPLTQRLLSAKHLLSTNTDLIDFGEEFNDTFIINLDTISFNPDVDNSVVFPELSFDDFDEENETFFLDKFTLVDNETKKEFEYVCPTRLYLNPEIHLKPNDDGNVVLASKALEGKYIFKYEPHNNELTKSLMNIIDLIESTNHLGITDYNELINMFNDLLIDNGINVMSVHAEMISSVLIKNATTGKELNFGADQLDDYNIVRISNSVLRGPLSKALAFERIDAQLVDLDTYEKDDSSVLDYLFK